MSTPETATPADLAVVKLATLFDLPALDIRILGADTFGAGSRATVEIQLSNGETMTFDTLREMGNAGILAAELAACTGATEARQAAGAGGDLPRAGDRSHAQNDHRQRHRVRVGPALP